MWHDMESQVDYIHFSPVANSVIDCIKSCGDQPICIGVSGEWGTGKTTLLRLTEKGLRDQAGDYIFIQFNAWMYQGFDDSRAALMESIANAIADNASASAALKDKAKSILKRINWFRVAGTAASTVATTALGLPPVGLIGGLWSAAKGMTDGKIEPGDIEALSKAAKELGQSLVSEVDSPPKQLADIRSGFEEALAMSGKRLVVFIDDLDRCLPKTAIETLEAIRLFLFIKNTAFIVAADTIMIKDSVRKHFAGLSESYVTSYFDKLIQIPIPVPALGVAEVTAYMFNLYIEGSAFPAEKKAGLRNYISDKVMASWRGESLHAAKLIQDQAVSDQTLIDKLRVAQSLSPIMCSPLTVGGNPRLIKRFLNSIAIRSRAASGLGLNLSEPILIKLHLLERFSPKLFETAASEIASSSNGQSISIKTLVENRDGSGREDNDFLIAWRGLSGDLAATDLRPYLQVARARAAIDIGNRPMSSEASELLETLISKPREGSLILRDRSLSEDDLLLMCDAYLSHCSAVKTWSSNEETNVLVALACKGTTVQRKIVAFFIARSPSSLGAAIVSKLRTHAWTREILLAWRSHEGLTAPTMKALDEALKKGA